MSHAIPGRRPVAEALRARRRLREVALEARAEPVLDDLAAQAAHAGVPVRRVQRAVLDELAGGVVHQGAMAVQTAFPYTSVEALSAGDLVVVLDGVTDPQNLGAIARSAEAAGAAGLVLPRRRAASVGPGAEKAAAGAFGWLRVALVPNVTRGLGELARAGYWSVGLTGDAGGELWSSPLLDGRVALVVGAEGRGLSHLVSQRVDGLVSIPMAGHLDSLNASAAAAVALFEVVRRRRSAGSP